MPPIAAGNHHRRRFFVIAAALVLTLIGAGVSKADPCADELTNFQQGSDGGWVQGGRRLPEVVLGLPQGGNEFAQSLDVLSLGTGGSLTLGFLDNAIIDLPGDDFRVFENAFRNSPSAVFREAAYVEASEDGTTFYRFPVAYTDGTPATSSELQATPVFDSQGLFGLAGLTPGLSHPDNGIDPRGPDAGGDGFDLAAIGLREARYIRIVDAANSINDEGNNFPINGQGKAGADIDTVVAIHSRETCGSCCDAVFDGSLKAQDLLTLLRVAKGLETQYACGDAPCQADQCGDMDDDEDVDSDDVWLCVDRALGEDVPCPAGNCDLSAVVASSRAGIRNASAALEIPEPNSIQSGIGIVSGWKCSAGKLTAKFDGGEALEVAYGTTRGDTATICGDQNNAFVMLWNYSNLSDGAHTLRLFDDGMEFASSTFRTQTLGQKFLSAEQTSGELEFALPHFPDPAVASGVRIGWQTASQSFGILQIDPAPAASENTLVNLAQAKQSTPGSLEIPAPDSTMSGISLVSGWRCDAGEITATFDQGDPIPVAYGTSRRDTLSICGDENNAYALQWNFGLLTAGAHTLEMRDGGEVFATRNFFVSGLGVPFYRGARGSYELPDFPRNGDRVGIAWSESSQGFRTIDYQPEGPTTPTPTPAATPTASASPTPGNCDGSLAVSVGIQAPEAGALILRLYYPDAVTLPESLEANGPRSRMETLIDPIPEISAFSHRGNHVAIGMIDTDGIPEGPLATIRFDCNGSRPTRELFRCEADVSDRSGKIVSASCLINLD